MPAPSADIPLWLAAPFALLLLLIAVMPLTPPRAKHAWERYYPHVALGLGALVVLHYLVRVPGGAGLVAHTAHEYVSFIALIGALFVVAGGIHLTVRGAATPGENVIFLLVGAVLANFVGTTGASMVLIRPWIRMNRARIAAHHIVFFIFVVSNVGGALTPIGDPPLFLGYLRGVPFFWLFEHVLAPWAALLTVLLVVFFVFDRRSFRDLTPRRQHAAERPETWRFAGAVNVPLILIVIGAVFLPETYFVREIAMLGAAIASWRLTPRAVHAENAFTFAPIREVAFLFAGIFATMMPALGYLAQHGHAFGFVRPLQYYFAAGGLSAVLDNAPTYVNFLELAQASVGSAGQVAMVPALLAARPELVVAISLGAVFFGAMTYIGNGPNFMVRSIAHDAGVPVPSFVGFILRYSLPILLPALVLVGLLFL